MASRLHGPGRVSLRSRLSLLAAAAVGVAVALAAVASYLAVRHQLYVQTDQNLAAEVSGATLANPDRSVSVLKLDQITRAGRSGDTVQLVTSTGQVVDTIFGGQQVAQPVIPVTKTDLALAGPGAAGQTYFHSAYMAHAHVRVLTTGLGPTTFGPFTFPGLAVAVAHPLGMVDTTLAGLRLILLVVSLGGIALALALGYVAARAMIRPVERLTAAAEHVAATQDLDATIDEAGDDELARLAHSFNAMLGALDGSRHQQAQLVADAGHELRTPLTSLRTNVEVLMRMPGLPAADRDALLTDVGAQLEELTTLVGDLVELAREDEQDPDPIDVSFDQIVNRAVERAQRRNVSLTFDVATAPGMVRAQPALLERAVLNVLDNAAKWSPAGGQVEVRLARGDRWELDIADRGPGIAEEDLPRVFDRFFRSDQARSMPGSGLGLAIVRQIVESHGGHVTATSPAGGGTLVHLELPTVAEEAPPPAWPDAPEPVSTLPAWPDR
ncbi:MAG: sensor histidine kinase [Acidimicrobiales bacterium]